MHFSRLLPRRLTSTQSLKVSHLGMELLGSVLCEYLVSPTC